MSINANTYETDFARLKSSALKALGDLRDAVANAENLSLKEELMRTKAELMQTKAELMQTKCSPGGHNGGESGGTSPFDKKKKTWKAMHHPEWTDQGTMMDKRRILSTGEYYVYLGSSCPQKTIQNISPGDTFIIREQTTKGKNGCKLSKKTNTNNLMVGIVKEPPKISFMFPSHKDPEKICYVIHIEWLGVYPLPNSGDGFNVYNNAGQVSIKEQTHPVHIIDYLGL